MCLSCKEWVAWFLPPIWGPKGEPQQLCFGPDSYKSNVQVLKVESFQREVSEARMADNFNRPSQQNIGGWAGGDREDDVEESKDYQEEGEREVDVEETNDEQEEGDVRKGNVGECKDVQEEGGER